MQCPQQSFDVDGANIISSASQVKKKKKSDI